LTTIYEPSTVPPTRCSLRVTVLGARSGRDDVTTTVRCPRSRRRWYDRRERETVIGNRNGCGVFPALCIRWECDCGVSFTAPELRQIEAGEHPGFTQARHVIR